MKNNISWTMAKIAVFAATMIYFGKIGQMELSFALNVVIIIGGVLLMLPVTLVGRRLLDRKPEAVSSTTAVVQALRLLFFGTAIIRAIKSPEIWAMGLGLPVPKEIGLAILIATGVVLGFTMLNLAVRGLGAPALVSSVQLATGWMYGKVRNPMVLALFLWLLSWGIYLQSGLFFLGVLLFFIPIELIFEKEYEERELEIRFGESYLEYRVKTPFLIPRFTLSQFSRKTTATAVGKFVISLVLAGSLIITADLAFAANWKEIPGSGGSAYIDTGVIEKNGVLSFWFLGKKRGEAQKYGEWIYQGISYCISLRKIEVDVAGKRMRSAHVVYFNEESKRIGEENTKEEWIYGYGIEFWAPLLKFFFAKERNGGDDEAVPPLPLRAGR